MKPRLFLDIDGVLNYSVGYRVFDYPRLFPEQCKYLQGICEVTGCEIVLCTNWRYVKGVEVIAEHLRKAGITAPVIGGTPLCQTRGEGVRQYRAGSSEPYVILDDFPDYYADQPLVLTYNEIGLTPELGARAIDILRGKPDQGSSHHT